MKRLFTILCICLFVIPLFAVPSSAAEYGLGYPKQFYYTNPSGASPTTWKLSQVYDYSFTEGLSIGYLDTLSKFGFGLYKDYSAYSYDSAMFYFGNKISYEEVIRNVRVPGYREYDQTFYMGTTSNLRNKIVFCQFIYENILLPINGQIFKVKFQFDTALVEAPDAVLQSIDLDYLCFLCDTSGRAGYPDRYSLPKVFPDTVYRNIDGNIVTFTFYFNLQQFEVESLSTSENVCLAVRLPYYFDGASYWESGVRIISNSRIPSSYEILTIGGYDQELEDINNSLDTIIDNENRHYQSLYNVLKVQNSSDVLYLNNTKSQFDDGKNVVNDYNNVNDQIQQLVTGAVIPDMQDIIDEQVGLSGDILNPVKEIFQNTYIVSAFLICFAFCLISVLLYGIRG